MLVLDTGVSWPAVALALIAAAPGIIAAVYAGKVNRAVRTPSGTLIGAQVENAHHVALANSYRLQVLNGEADGPETREARRIEHESVPDAPPLPPADDPSAS